MVSSIISSKVWMRIVLFLHQLFGLLVIRPDGPPRLFPYSTLPWGRQTSSSVTMTIEERFAAQLRCSLALHVVEAIDSSASLLPTNVDVESECCERGESAGPVSITFSMPKQDWTYSPTSVNANKALYILHTMMPTSSFQCSISHMFARVPLIYHANNAQLKPHRNERRALIAIFNDGCNPVKQCIRMVEVRATTDASDAAVSCTCVVSSMRMSTSRNGYNLPK